MEEKLDRIIELLEQQTELLQGIAAAEISSAQANESLMSSLLGATKPGQFDSYFEQRLEGGAGNARRGRIYGGE